MGKRALHKANFFVVKGGVQGKNKSGRESKSKGLGKQDNSPWIVLVTHINNVTMQRLALSHELRVSTDFTFVIARFCLALETCVPPSLRQS